MINVRVNVKQPSVSDQVVSNCTRIISQEKCNFSLYMSIPGNGNRGVGGIFGIPPPWPKIFRKYPPPWRFWVKPPFCFLNERKTLKFTLNQLDLGLIKLN